MPTRDYAREVYRPTLPGFGGLAAPHGCGMFSSLHTDATLILMEELEKAGITGFVGKVNMDRNSAPGLLQETTEESRRETLRWLEACQDFPHIKPILTPRFIPSCTDGLMTFLGKLAQERGLPASPTCRKPGGDGLGPAAASGLRPVLGGLRQVRPLERAYADGPLCLVRSAGARRHAGLRRDHGSLS